MKRLAGILLMVLVLYGTLLFSDESARSKENHANLAKRCGRYGVITLGAGLLIISGGIDLSIGSVVGLSAVTFALLLERRVSPLLAGSSVLIGAALLGLIHGLMVTRVGLQPFVLTLCGLFIYRGLAMWATRTEAGSSRNVGIGGRDDLERLRWIADGSIGEVPVVFLLMLGIAVVVGVLLHLSVYGRYLYAVGYNEQAAQYAGVNVKRYKAMAYVICSLLAGLSGILELLYVETAQPSSAGQGYELYAITGAVLGGCSLRGGQGMVIGIVLGTAVLPLLRSLIIFTGIPSDLEATVIGVALLFGTITDELLKRRSATRKT